MSHLVTKFEHILTLLEEFFDLLQDEEISDEESTKEIPIQEPDTPVLKRTASIWSPFVPPGKKEIQEILEDSASQLDAGN